GVSCALRGRRDRVRGANGELRPVSLLALAGFATEPGYLDLESRDAWHSREPIDGGVAAGEVAGVRIRVAVCYRDHALAHPGVAREHSRETAVIRRERDETGSVLVFPR